MQYSTYYDSPIGQMLLISTDRDLIGLWFVGQKYFDPSVIGEFQQCDEFPFLVQVKRWLDAYFSGKKPPISDLALAPEGSDYRKMVWRILCNIPYGECMTYGEIAKVIALKLGKRSMSSQAVGGAVGRNPISIIIPCHRVVGSNGSLTGYAGGLEKKIRLLELERVDMSKLFTPKK